MELLNYGFNQYKVDLLYEKGSKVGTTTKVLANEEKINLIAKNDVLVLQKKTDEEKELKTEIQLEDVSLPIKKGSKLGYIYIKENNKIIASSPLIADKTIKKINIFKLYFINLKNILTGN